VGYCSGSTNVIRYCPTLYNFDSKYLQITNLLYLGRCSQLFSRQFFSSILSHLRIQKLPHNGTEDLYVSCATMPTSAACRKSNDRTDLSSHSSTGVTGYVGGDALYTLYNAHPDWEFTALVRNSEKAAPVAAAFPKVRFAYGTLEDSAVIEEEAAKADIVLRKSRLIFLLPQAQRN
jgi:hypothetical protein